jgi:hypothetical protein
VAVTTNGWAAPSLAFERGDERFCKVRAFNPHDVASRIGVGLVGVKDDRRHFVVSEGIEDAVDRHVSSGLGAEQEGVGLGRAVNGDRGPFQVDEVGDPEVDGV